MRHINGIKEIVEKYDYFIFDVWGVVHDGSELYPQALDTFKYLKKIDKKLLLIPIKNSHLDKLIKAYEYLIDPKEIRIQSLSIPKKKSLSLSKEPKQQSLPLSKQLKQKSLSLLKEKEQPIATNSSIFAMILEVPKYINETYKNLAKDWYNILFTQTVS